MLNIGLEESTQFLISYMIWYLSISLITDPSWILLGEIGRGAFSQWLLSYKSPTTILISKMVSNTFISLIRIFILFLLVTQIIEIEFGVTLFTLPILIFTILSLLGIGLILAGFTLIYKKISDILPILQYVLLGIVGINISISYYHFLFPFYSSVIIIKKDLLLQDVSLQEFFIFSSASVITFTIGIVFLNKMLKVVKRMGILERNF